MHTIRIMFETTRGMGNGRKVTNLLTDLLGIPLHAPSPSFKTCQLTFG